MRVAILTWRDSGHPDGGGSEVFVERVAAELVRRGHPVEMFTARYPGAAAEGDLDGVRVHRRGGRLTVYPRGLWWVARHRRRHDVVLDVINGLPFGTPLVRRGGVVALVHHSHERQWHLIYPGWRGALGWFVERRLVPLVYRRRPHLTVSEDSRADLVAHGIPGAQVTVARNGVDPPHGSPDRSPTPRLVVLARLVPHKRIEDAFEVVRRLAPEIPGLHLDVVGDGWWRDELEADAADLVAPGLVVFHGHVDEAERDRLLGSAWAMLLPSVKEGWGLAALEAATLGTPTVGYRYAGGLAEAVVDGATGLLADDLPGLVQATRRILADDALRVQLGEAAQRRASTFTWERTTDVVERVLQGAAQTRRRG
ncbi:glycosyltransferase family 4 protein [Nocardioides sp.]|uniref:glycosyltransferase family 4 protein n=1 Tax=Nocardioides sp. TaxID=35761 RepID=UPI00378374CC